MAPVTFLWPILKDSECLLHRLLVLICSNVFSLPVGTEVAKGNSLWRQNKWTNVFFESLPVEASLISLRKCFLTIIVWKIPTFNFHLFDKMETLLFAKKMEPLDPLISIFNGVLRKGWKGDSMWIVSQIACKVSLTNRHCGFVKTCIVFFFEVLEVFLFFYLSCLSLTRWVFLVSFLFIVIVWKLHILKIS